MKKRVLLAINICSNAILAVAMSSLFSLDIADLLAAHPKGKHEQATVMTRTILARSVVIFTAK
jgi:hypothetical protein